MLHSLQRSRLPSMVRQHARPLLYLVSLLLVVILATLLVELFLAPPPVQAQTNPTAYISQHMDMFLRSLITSTGTLTETLAQTMTDTPMPSDTPISTSTAEPIDTFTATPTDMPLSAAIPALTDTPTQTMTTPPAPTGTPTATDAPIPAVDTVTASNPDMPSFTATAALGAPPHILISEFMADPKAVADKDGEWIELYNAGDSTVNLRGWIIADLGSDYHQIQNDLLIEPGKMVVLARNANAATNGGVPVDYVYTGINLANDHDAVLLRAPNDSEQDRVVWGGDTGLNVKSGASLQRTTWTGSAIWETSQSPWPGSMGDAGAPGSLYTLPPTGAVTPTPFSDNAWIPVTAVSPLQLEEVAYQGNDEEFIALLNTTDTPVDLTGWVIGDAAKPGGSEGMYDLPAGSHVDPGTLFVIARNGATFRGKWGHPANAEFEEDDPDTPTLPRRRDLASGSLALNDSGDEVVLLNPTGQLADAVAFTGGDYTALRLTGELRPAKGYSLQRVPGAAFPIVADVRHRFLYAPPQPFAMRTLPIAQTHERTALSSGFSAVWGSLGAHSNFSAGYTAPPHYVLAAAAAQGLDFTAFADATPAPPIIQQNGIVPITAWSWQDSAGTQAVIYSHTRQLVDNQVALLNLLETTGSPAQWQGEPVPNAAHVAAIAADDINAFSALPKLYKRWLTTKTSLLPAGNANPPLPGAVDPAPRYTGLAVSTLDETGILEALTAHRGWLTSAPGLWLTVQAELANGERQWMGSAFPPGNQVTLHIAYGDQSGQPAGLAIWQDKALCVSSMQGRARVSGQ